MKLGGKKKSNKWYKEASCGKGKFPTQKDQIIKKEKKQKQKKNASFPVSPPVLPSCLLVITEVLCLQEKKRGKCNHSNKLTIGRGRKKKAESKPHDTFSASN